MNNENERSSISICRETEKKVFPFVIIYNKLNKMYKRTDLLKAFLCTSKCKILVHFCFFIISFTYFSTSFAAPQIPASFASSASANSVSLSAKNAISLNGPLM